MENKKMTKKNYFELLKGIVSELDLSNKTDIIDFIDNEINLLNRKANYKGTSKTQVENAKIKEMLINALIEIDKPITITELMEYPIVANYVLENGNKLSNQKITALFTQMLADNAIIRTTEKRKSYFTVA